MRGHVAAPGRAPPRARIAPKLAAPYRPLPPSYHHACRQADGRAGGVRGNVWPADRGVAQDGIQDVRQERACTRLCCPLPPQRSCADTTSHAIAPPILRRFYGNDSPAKSETGVGQWLGFTNCIMGATFGVLSTADLSKSDKKKLYSIGAASCAAGSAIAQHQVGSKGFDKTQATVATVLNVAMGAMYAKKLLE